MGGVLCILLFIFGTFLQDQLCIAAEVGQPGTSLEIGQFIFSGAQLAVDDAYALFDEVGTFLCHFILLGIGVYIVERYQIIDEIDGPLCVCIFQTDGSNGAGFGGRLYRQGGAVANGYGSGPADGGFQLDGLDREWQGVSARNGDYADRQGQDGRKLVKMLLYFLLLVILCIADFCR